MAGAYIGGAICLLCAGGDTCDVADGALWKLVIKMDPKALGNLVFNTPNRMEFNPPPYCLEALVCSVFRLAGRSFAPFLRFYFPWPILVAISLV